MGLHGVMCGAGLERDGRSRPGRLFLSGRRMKLGHHTREIYGVLLAWGAHFTPQDTLSGSTPLGAAVAPSGREGEQHRIHTWWGGCGGLCWGVAGCRSGR